MKVKFTDSIRVVGKIRVFKNDILVVEDNNMVVDVGKNLIASLLQGSGYLVNQLRVGDNPVVADPLQEDLQGNTLATATGSMFTSNVFDNTVEYDASFPVGMGLGAVAEAGLFNPNDIMLARKGFPVVNITPTDSMSIFWTITIK